MQIVKAVIVGKENTTFFLEDGSKRVIQQGSVRLDDLVNDAINQISKTGSAKLDLDVVSNSYKSFEESTNEVIKFFQVAKSAIQILMDAVNSVNLDSLLNQNAKPMGHTSGTSIDAGDTIIAVVDGKVVPSIEKVQNQIIRACASGSTKGMEAFLKRAASVSKERQHSVEDLMTFVQKSDLPIANDGCIIAYKILHKVNDTTFVDNHTKKVKQYVGDLVCINPDLVDTNRNIECSSGLHIARRAYVKKFYNAASDVGILIKLSPEDVITVPHGDPDKVRVLAYHNLAELPKDMMHALFNDRPITTCNGGTELLDKAIQGDFPEPRNKVTINGDLGTNITYTVLPKSNKKESTRKATNTALAKPMSDSDTEYLSEPVDPNMVIQKMKQSQKEIAKDLYAKVLNGDAEAKNQLHALKKQSKKSYAALGIPQYSGE